MWSSLAQHRWLAIPVAVLAQACSTAAACTGLRTSWQASDVVSTRGITWRKELAGWYHWLGYKRIAVIARREGLSIGNKRVYQVLKEDVLLQRPWVRAAAVHRAARLFELLPIGPNQLSQSDVTDVHVPGHGWWYAVTVIDDYSRYLLACLCTPSYRAADVTAALDVARQEAERHHGPLVKTPFLVTDNGPWFLTKRFQQHIHGAYAHARINYRTPTQLGLLERFHQTMKTEEVYRHLNQNPAEARGGWRHFGSGTTPSALAGRCAPGPALNR